jgi:hypothetical protein
MKRRLEQASDDVRRGGAAAGAGPGLGDQHRRQPIEKLPHAGRQDLFEPFKGVGQIALEWGAGNRLQQMTAQIERAQLGERKASLKALEDMPVDSPAGTAVFVALVVQREACFLERRKVAANRACGDLELTGQRVNRRAVTRWRAGRATAG